MTPIIRPYQPGDEQGMCEAHVQAIRRTLAPLYEANVIEVWSQKDPAKYAEFAQNGETYFVAEEDGQILGLSGWKDEDLSVLYIHPDAMGQGLGKQLLQVAEADYRAKTGNASIKTEATLYAKPFYEKHGFETIEQATHTFRDGVTTMPAWKMIKHY